MDTSKFRTRQEFRTLINPKGKDFIIGLDAGYSGTKTFFESGCGTFPTYARKIDEMLYLTDENDIVYRDDDTGEMYLIGYAAQNMVDDIDTNDTDGELFSRKRYGSKLFHVACEAAIGKTVLQKNDNRKIVVQTGLPASYMADTPSLVNSLSGSKNFSLKIGSAPWKKVTYDVKKEDIFVMPQPTGAMYSVLIKNDGKYIPEAKNILTGNILVFDIGFGTFDFFGIKNRAVVCRESLDMIGMREVLQSISKKINEDLGEDIRVIALQKNLETGKIVCIGEDNDGNLVSEEKSIVPYLEAANKEVLFEAMEKAKSVTNQFRGYKHLIIGGGTGEAWYDGISKKLSGLSTLKIYPSNINDRLPFIYSNARGYYMYRYMVSKK